MSEFLPEIILAIITSLLALIMKTLYNIRLRKNKRLTYTIRKIPIFASCKELPIFVRTAISEEPFFNVARFHVIVKNTEKKSISNVNILFKPNKDNELIGYTISTDPPEIVKYTFNKNKNSNVIHVDDINLKKDQSITFDIYLKSENDPIINVYWSNENDVEIIEGPVEGVYSLTESIIGIIRNSIYALISAPVITGVSLFAFVLYSLQLQKLPFNLTNSSLNLTNSSLMQQETISHSVNYFGGMIGHLISLYFFFQIFPYALSLVRDYEKQKNYGNIIEKDFTGIIRNCIFALTLPFIFYSFSHLVAEIYLRDVFDKRVQDSIIVIIENMLKFYFFLKIMPFSINLIKELRKSKVKMI